MPPGAKPAHEENRMLKQVNRVYLKLFGSIKVPIGEANFRLRREHYQARHAYICGFEKVLKNLISVCNSKTLFLDIGANVGLFSITIASRTGASAYSFEPIPSTFKHLVENIVLNAGLAVIPFNLAVSSAPMRVWMVAEPSSGINRIVDNPDGAAIDRSVPMASIRSITLDQIAGLLPLDEVESVVVKIDVERHELDVICGGTNTFFRLNIPMLVCIECDLDTSKVERVMLDNGFQKDCGMSIAPDIFFANRHWVSKFN
jgi:FkbM family methyltransferase